jgi:hypothetical protein
MITAKNIKEFCQEEINAIAALKERSKYMHPYEEKLWFGRKSAFEKVIKKIEFEEMKDNV